MSSAPRFVQRLGLVLVAAGLIAGVAVYFHAAAADPEADAMAQQREMREVARLGGTAAVQTVKFKLWLASLWHGERLGLTLAVLGMVVGGACWRLGLLMGEEDFDE